MLTNISNNVPFIKPHIMTTTSQKTAKLPLDVSVEMLHSKETVTAFKVKSKEGRFIVIDYTDRFSKNPDTEIFWESGVIKVMPHTSEYKTIYKFVTEFLKRQTK
jgi:hypothetical protein